MSEPPAIPSVLGIESVEWLAEGGENLTVRVTGRWRRRRPAWSAQPVLVLEAAGRRFRFPAMPEPPSVSGVGPGMWRISFSVPAALAPALGGRTWLQVGAVVVPLPAAAKPLTDVSATDVPSVAAPAAEGRQAPPEPPAMSPPSPEVEVERVRRRAREAEESAREAEHEAAELTGRVRALEAELSAARSEAEHLRVQLDERERTRRSAEQRAHSEQALRRDLARQLAARDRGGERVRAQLAGALERIRELERELRAARRRGDEAEQLALAAGAARQRAERRAELAQRPPPPERLAELAGRAPPRVPEPSSQRAQMAGAARRETLRLEQALVARQGERASHISSAPRPVPRPSHLSPEPPAVGTPSEALVPALRHELEARAAGEAALRARLVEAEARLGARALLQRGTSELMAQLRQELDGLRSGFQRERRARRDAERRVEQLDRELDVRRERTLQAHRAIAELRQALGALAAGVPAAEPPRPEAESGGQESRTAEPDGPPGGQDSRPVEPDGPPGGQESRPVEPDGPPGGQESRPVEPDRLNDARQRLREASAPLGEQSELPAGSSGVAPTMTTLDAGRGAELLPDSERTERAWLEPIWTALARTDPELAGRLLVELLPAQREVVAQPVAYDLVFAPGRCLQITVNEDSLAVRHSQTPRPGGEVDFQVFGETAAIARLLVAGPWRRRFGPGVARVRGRRDRLAALRALPALRRSFRGFDRIGIRLDSELALRLVALMIDPAWTVKEHFAVGYVAQGGATAYLLISDGSAPQVTRDVPATGVVTTITGPADAAALMLSGDRMAETKVAGEEWPLGLVREWINRAQSG